MSEQGITRNPRRPAGHGGFLLQGGDHDPGRAHVQVGHVSYRDTAVVQRLRITVVQARIDIALDAYDRRKFAQLAMLLRDLKAQACDLR